MSAGLAGTKLLVLVGAGVTGSIVLNNPYVTEIFKDVAKILVKRLRDSGGAREGVSEEGGGLASDASTAALTAQVRKLALELRQLSTQSRQVTVIRSESGGGGSGVLAIVVPVAVLGAAGYGYMWWKGWKMSDLMYVTRRSMSQAVKSFSEQMNHLSSALSATKKQLTGRLDVVSKTLTDSVQVQAAIRKEVGDVHRAVHGVDGEVRALQGNVHCLEDKIDGIQQSSVLAAEGVMLLCRVVSQGLEGRPEFKRDLDKFSQLPLHPPLMRSFSATSSASSPALLGLKDLQVVVSELESSQAVRGLPPIPAQGRAVSRSRSAKALGGIEELADGDDDDDGAGPASAWPPSRSADAHVPAPRQAMNEAAQGQDASRRLLALGPGPAPQPAAEAGMLGGFAGRLFGRRSMSTTEAPRLQEETYAVDTPCPGASSTRDCVDEAYQGFTEDDLTFPPRTASPLIPPQPSTPRPTSAPPPSGPQSRMPPVRFGVS